MSSVLIAQAPIPLSGPAAPEQPQRSGMRSQGKIERIEQALRRGEKKLPWTDRHGYLEGLLSLLDIPVESQVLVFSKTSLQNDQIGPAHPRAIYFGDDAYLGWVQGGALMEITVVDPVKGPLFFALEQKPQKTPKFLRETDRCLRCHASPAVDDLPSSLVRSVHPDDRGLPSMKNGSFLTTHESPLAERWGGWYVSGSTGGQAHMGNRCADPITERLSAAVSDVKDLSDLVTLSPYLTPHSDVVALMVLEHQGEMQNRLAHAAIRTRTAMARDAAMVASAPDGEVKDGPSMTTRRRIRSEADRILRYLLLCEEQELHAAVVGDSGFRARYEATGPRDEAGRSLRQLDLKTRLFRYSCSPLIYSESFDALPKPLLTAVYKKLWRVLSGRTRRAPFDRMDDDTRRAVLEILAATKRGLPSYWSDRER